MNELERWMGESVLQEKDFEYAKDRGGVTAFIMCGFRAPSVDGCRVKWQCDYDI